MKPGGKRKDFQTIHVVSQLVDLMLGNIFPTKYTNPISPIVDAYIKNICI